MPAGNPVEASPVPDSQRPKALAAAAISGKRAVQAPSSVTHSPWETPETFPRPMSALEDPRRFEQLHRSAGPSIDRVIQKRPQANQTGTGQSWGHQLILRSRRK